MQRVVNNWIVTLVFALSAETAAATLEEQAGSIQSFAMAGAVDLFKISPFSTLLLPALSPERGVGVEANWGRMHGMSEFELYSAAAGYVRGHWAGVIGLQQLGGSEFYWERNFGLAMSRQLAGPFRIGLRGAYQAVEFGEGYRSLDRFSWGCGAVLEIDSSLRAAIAGHNLGAGRFTDGTEATPRSVLIALGWAPTDELTVSLMHDVIEHLPDRFHAGQRLKIAGPLALLVGIATNPTDFAGGATIKVGGIEFEYGYRNNVYLGGTHRFGVLYAR